MAYSYGITNGRGSTLAANLGTSDPTLTTIGALLDAIGTSRYNILIDSEIIGVTDCDTNVWTILERGVSGTVNTTHTAPARITNQLDADYLQHLNGSGLVVVDQQIKTGPEPAFDFDLSTVPLNAETLLIRIVGACDGGDTDNGIWMEANGDDVGPSPAGHYDFQAIQAVGATVSTDQDNADNQVEIGRLPGGGATLAGATGLIEITLPNFRSAVWHKVALGRTAYALDLADNSMILRDITWYWADAAPITSLHIETRAPNFLAGTMAVLYAEVGLSIPSGADTRGSVAGRLYLAANFR